MVKFQRRAILGKWRAGFALDLQTLSSTPIGHNEYGHMQFDSQRSEVGELLYQLKYRGDQSVVPAVVEAVASAIGQPSDKIEAIVPVPPSTPRAAQPVAVLAAAIGNRLGIPVVDCVKRIKQLPQLKNVYDLDERLKMLEGAHSVDKAAVQGKKVLLFDDLYRSGATMNAITPLLYDEGGARDVVAVTITRTRSNQ
jgi:predicted amidophosphoribosyltransferase